MKIPGLTIVPIGGLANRMRVVMSALKIAEEQSFPVRVVWSASDECKAEFTDLFLPITNTSVQFVSGTWKDAVSTKWNLYIPRLLRSSKYAFQLEDFHPEHADITQVVKGFASVYVSTCYMLTPYEPVNVPDAFRLRPDLLQRVNNITSDFSVHTMGVHVRCTDNKESLLHSPSSAFYPVIDNYLHQYADARIFLCTDDDLVKQQMQERYGSQLLTRRVSQSRSSLTGMQDAAIDLWCLSRAQQIVGSYYSSFSEAAAEIGNKSLQVINISSSK